MPSLLPTVASGEQMRPRFKPPGLGIKFLPAWNSGSGFCFPDAVDIQEEEVTQDAQRICQGNPT